MNAKIQTLISNLREAGETASARMIEINLEISEAKAIEHIQEIVEDYTGVRTELCAAFLAEMDIKAVASVANVVEVAPVAKPVTRRTYFKYLDFMGRQGQPSDYNSEAEYNQGRNYTAFERILAKAEFSAPILSDTQKAAVAAEEQFIAEALEIKAAATELSQSEWVEAERFASKLGVGEIRGMMDLVAGARDTDSIKLVVRHCESDGLVEFHGAYVRLTPKGMKVAKFFTGALA